MPGGSPIGPRPRGFAITDLLGLEADLPSPAGPGPGSGCEGPAAAPCPGPGLGGPCLARGALPLGLGLLCGFSARPPVAARAPCLLLADVPFLPPEGPEPAAPQAPSRPPPALGRQKRSESVSTSGNQARPAHPAPAPVPSALGRAGVTRRRPHPQHPRSKGIRDPGAWPRRGRRVLAAASPAPCLCPSLPLLRDLVAAALLITASPGPGPTWGSRRPAAVTRGPFRQRPARLSASGNGVGRRPGPVLLASSTEPCIGRRSDVF